ncbi:MAG: hypothetical protein BRC50_08590 [Cyanobacteria bacterium SW_11_48_12]|nr:MAG: hypothetical protein BRC50_08590 [Cyanobacteria bacterium SW_11_48_12]
MQTPYSFAARFSFYCDLSCFKSNRIVPQLWKGACVVMDNAKFHQGEMVRKSLEQAGARLIYLPSYSPEFSPRENFWSILKAILKKVKARTYKNLVDGIKEARSKVTNSDVRHWFTHCCYCTP